MKKTVFSLGFLVAASFAAHAADTPKKPAVKTPVPSAAALKKARLMRNQQIVQELDALNLTPAQKSKIQAIMIDARDRRRAIRLQKLPPTVKRQRRLAIAAGARKQIALLLTPSQKKQVAQMGRTRRAQLALMKQQAAPRQPVPQHPGTRH